MTGIEWQKIDKLMNAWMYACRVIGNGNMNWALKRGIKEKDAKYLFQLYFRALAAGNNVSSPKLTRYGMRRLNEMWRLVNIYYDPAFTHSRILNGPEYDQDQYSKEPLVY